MIPTDEKKVNEFSTSLFLLYEKELHKGKKKRVEQK